MPEAVSKITQEEWLKVWLGLRYSFLCVLG